MSDDANYKLYYFPCRGRGEIIRYLFAYAEILFDEKLITFEEWPDYKSSTPMGQLPVLEVGTDNRLCQSSAIARYLANVFGISGRDSWNKAYADMLVQGIVDLYDNLRPTVRALRAGNKSKMADEWSKFSLNFLKPTCGRYETFLGDNQWFCQNEFTHADIVVAEFLERVHSCYDNEILHHYPRLNELTHRLHDLPNIKKYVERRPKYKF